MFKKESRFEVVFMDGSVGKEAGSQRIIVDRETGVNYLVWTDLMGGGITPLLDSNGNVVIQKK